jgi:hypothetical protein
VDVLQMERGAPMASEIAAFAAVSTALWEQREAMHRLAAALAGVGDLRTAIEDVRFGEILRAAETEELARQLGQPADSALADLAAAAAEPWQTMLLDHAEALRRVYTEITGIAAATGRRFWQESLDDFLG